jgi:hypothetical protein
LYSIKLLNYKIIFETFRIEYYFYHLIRTISRPVAVLCFNENVVLVLTGIPIVVLVFLKIFIISIQVVHNLTLHIEYN